VALIFGVVGFLFNPFLVFIALLVWMAASGESLTVQTRALLAGIPVTPKHGCARAGRNSTGSPSEGEWVPGRRTVA